MLTFFDDNFMKQDKIVMLLANLGLSKIEIDCYLALLKNSPQRASDLSKKLDVPKATILAALYRLSDEAGIVRKSKKKNLFLFFVEDAKDLLSYIQRKEEEIKISKTQVENMLPELRSMQNFDAKKPQVFYFEGKEGLKAAFEKVLEEADEMIGYGSLEDDQKYLSDLYPDYYDRRVKKKIPVTGIIPATDFNVQEVLKNEVKHLRKTRLIGKEFNFPIQVNVYKNTAVFYSLEESFALMIRSKPVADCLKKIFKMAFENAEEEDIKIRQKNK